MSSFIKESTHPELLHSFQYYEDLWSQVSSHSARSLLRLAILRDLQDWLHSQISHQLTLNQKTLTQSLRFLEEKTLKLGTRSLIDEKLPFPTLIEMLKQPEALSPTQRTIPESIFEIFPRTLFHRPDSFWKSALIAEGSILQWKISKFSTSVPLVQVETWNKKFFQNLWPRGVFLWVEAAEKQSNLSSSNLWKGNWFTLLDPSFKPHEEPLIGTLEWTLL